MSASKNPTAGLGDPYWYEWSVGESYIIEMLDPASGIRSVTLQRTGVKGLDDVVVSLANGDSLFIQVKHTRAADTLTFGDLVGSGSGNEDDGTPLLRQIAEAWKTEEDRSTGACEAWLFTNRAAGRRRSSTTGSARHVRPPLEKLLAHLNDKLPGATTLADLDIPPDWKSSWTSEWLPQLAALSDDATKLQFMQQFKIKTSQADLAELRDALVERLSSLFAVSPQTARGLLARLDNALDVWATSARGSAEAVTVEAVYDRLCLLEDAPVGAHALAPPAPFFTTRTQVANEVGPALIARAAPIIFVVGEPGSGKTALISALANQRDPIIGARFHAYRPITPDNQLLPADAGETTTARALWSDLLIQLRSLCGGRLAKLQVPIHAGLLAVDVLRNHVLRIADALGDDEGRPFVIAVDGIDHAARAGNPVATFLDSLPPPSEIPANVVLLIGGQPPEGYPAYPQWLRATTEGVRRWDLPRLGMDDTQQLVDARMPELPAADRENVCRDIFERCQGNTLSTVFAVEEAVLASSRLDQLPSILDNRQLGGGVEAYYKSIWSAATRALLPSTGTRLAASLSLAPARVTSETVGAVVRLGAGEQAEWSDVMRMLRPLVLEESDGFRVFHNDVRVFLLRLLQAEPEIYKECAGRLADQLMTSAAAGPRHAAAQNLFGIADRPEDQVSVFTPSYVLEANAIGQALGAITRQGVVAIQALNRVGENWDLAHGLAMGLRTLEQLRASVQWRGDSTPTRHIASAATRETRGAERSVPPQASWTPGVITAALDDIIALHGADEEDRAVAAFTRWFGGLSPSEIAGSLSDKQDPHDPDDRSVMSVMEKIGIASVATKKFLVPGADAKRADVGYARGVFDALPSSADDRDFIEALRHVRGFAYVDFQSLLTKLVDRRDWRRCGLLLRRTSPSPKDQWPFRLLGAAVAALVGDSRSHARWAAPVLADRDAAIAGATSTSTATGFHDQTHSVVVMCWTALLLGIEEPSRDASSIRSELETAFQKNPHDERKHAGMAQALHAAALLGAVVRSVRDSGTPTARVAASTIAQTVEVLLTASTREPYHLPLGFPHAARLIIRGFVDCAEYDITLLNSLRDMFREAISSGEFQGVFTETVWGLLSKTGNRADLVVYARRWVGDDGRAWSEPPAERYDLVNRFAHLLEDLGESALAASALERLSWADIGYTGHKEVVLQQPLQWFEALANDDPAVWRNEGLRLFALSQEASRTGDNRMAWHVENGVLTAACRTGAPALAQLTRGDDPVVAADEQCIISGVVGMLAHRIVNRQELLSVWALCAGQLCWQSADDRESLVEAREAILAAGSRCGIDNLADVMQRTAQAEFACEPERDDNDASQGSRESPPGDVKEAVTTACASENWRAAAAAIGRARDEGLPDLQDVVETARAALLSRRQRIWFYDGSEPAFTALFPLITPDQRWEFVSSAITSDDFDDNQAYRTQTLAENLDDLCRLNAMTQDRSALLSGLRSLLDMHETWMSGSGRLASLPRLQVAEPENDLGWEHLTVEILFRCLRFDEQTYQKAALRGLAAIWNHVDELRGHILSMVDKELPETRRRFLMITEALAINDTTGELSAWATQQREVPRLDVALSSWLALSMGHRAETRVDEPKWPPPTAQPSLIVAAGPPPIITTGTRKGLQTSAGRAINSVMRQLRAACHEDLDDIEAELARSLRDDPVDVRSRRCRQSRRCDMVNDCRGEAELDRLFSLLHRHEREGRFQNIPLLRLAQALVSCADPFVFLDTPSPWTAPAATWPIDHELDTLLKDSPRPLVQQQLADLLSADVSTSCRIVSGTLRTFSSRMDAKLSLDHAAGDAVRNPDGVRPTVLCGRWSFVFAPPGTVTELPGEEDAIWLTRDVAGLFALGNAVLDHFPSQLWLDQLGWIPDAEHPLTWTRDGQRVAWFERRHGPVRRIYGDDYLGRQPTLTRWVCLASEWSRIEDILGPIKRYMRLSVALLNES